MRKNTSLTPSIYQSTTISTSKFVFYVDSQYFSSI